MPTATNEEVVRRYGAASTEFDIPTLHEPRVPFDAPTWRAPWVESDAAHTGDVES